MKSKSLSLLVCLLASTVAFAAPTLAGPVVGDKALVDGTLDKGITIDLDAWFATHPLKAGDPTRGDTVFKSPRMEVVLVTNHGPLIGTHFHKSADEIVFVYEGQGEMYIDGKWTPVKAGDLHVNPRGVIHATRVVGDKDMRVFSIFTPPQAGGNDKVMLDKEPTDGQGVGDKALVDTKWDKNLVASLDPWYAAHPLKAGDASRGDDLFKSERGQVVIVTNHGPLIGTHFHKSADEVVYIQKGKSEIYLNGDWKPVGGGQLHINPRGVIHATRVTGAEDLQVYSVFGPPQAGGDDKVFVKTE